MTGPCNGIKAHKSERGQAFIDQHGQGWRQALNKKEKQMDREVVFRMATDAGLYSRPESLGPWNDKLEAFAQAIRAATLEEMIAIMRDVDIPDGTGKLEQGFVDGKWSVINAVCRARDGSSEDKSNG